jgi:exosortase C (VPDSG-CTERM-specific)
MAKTDLHSHTLLIPFISAYLIYVERRRLPVRYTFSWLSGLVVAIIAIGLVLAAGMFPAAALALGHEGPVAMLILGFILLVNAGAFFCFGTTWMRAAAFPMFFLVFLVPLPETIVYHLEHCLKLASAEVAASLFEIARVPVLRDALIFQLPGITLEVAQECSGIRSSYVLFMTSLVAAYLFLRSPWRRILLVTLVIPLGVIRNGFRILVIGWLCVHYGPQMIDTWIHHRGGPVFFVLSLFPLFLLLWWLWRSENGRLATGAAGNPRSEASGGGALEKERFS